MTGTRSSSICHGHEFVVKSACYEGLRSEARSDRRFVIVSIVGALIYGLFRRINVIVIWIDAPGVAVRSRTEHSGRWYW
jgi:hypothetical protein